MLGWKNKCFHQWKHFSHPQKPPRQCKKVILKCFLVRHLGNPENEQGLKNLKFDEWKRFFQLWKPPDNVESSFINVFCSAILEKNMKIETIKIFIYKNYFFNRENLQVMWKCLFSCFLVHHIEKSKNCFEWKIKNYASRISALPRTVHFHLQVIPGDDRNFREITPCLRELTL